MSETDPLEEVALKCEQAAQELSLAAQHMQTTADHFRNREVPRAGAHSLATHGHMERARALLAEVAMIHAGRAVP